MFFCLALIILASFLIVDSFISYKIIKDMEKYKQEFFDVFTNRVNGLHRRVSGLKESLEEKIEKSEKRIYRPRRSVKKNDDKGNKDIKG